MTALQDRPRTAVMIVEVLDRVFAEVYRRDQVLANISTLVDNTRRGDVPVVWVQHHDEEMIKGSTPWQIVPELSPDPTESPVHKGYADAFEETDLEDVLAARRTRRGELRRRSW